MSLSKNLRIYAATHEGLFTLDGEGKPSGEGGPSFPGAIVDCIKVQRATPTTLFAGIAHGGLYRSRDAGKSWEKRLEGDIRAVLVDPSDDRVVYVGTEPVHLYRSEDGGESFEEIASLQRLPDDTRRKLGLPPEPKGARDLDNPRFRHGRQEWTGPIPPYEGHITEIFVRPDKPDEIYLSIEHGGIAVSFDRGQSWEDASEGIDYLDIHKVVRLRGTANRYLASTSRGFYATDDLSKAWARAEQGVERDYFHELLMLPSAPGSEVAPLLVCCAEGSPGNWPATRQTLGQWTYGVKGARAALYRSDDGARSWHRVGAGQGLPEEMAPMIWSLQRHPEDSQALFAGIGEVGRGFAIGTAGKGSITVSGDQGSSWRAIREDLPAVRQIAVVPA